MAFTIEVISDSTAITLTDGNPFTLRAARGMAGAPVRRVVRRGPAQDGDTDLGYRLQPREIELEIGFAAATDAALDAYRDLLVSAFRPSSYAPLHLRVTRDDNRVRQIDCHTIDFNISLLPEHRPGHYHVATVRLYAPDPAYYDPTPYVKTVAGTPLYIADWYLAGGDIDPSQVLMHGTAPAQNEAWSYMGNIPSTVSYTLALRMEYVEPNGARIGDNAFTAGSLFFGIRLLGVGAKPAYAGPNTFDMGTTFMTPGTANYFFRHNPDGWEINGEPSPYSEAFVNYTGSITLYPNVEAPGLGITGTPRRWRADHSGQPNFYWPGEIPLYALYSPGLTDEQIASLEVRMRTAISTSVYMPLSIDYEADVPEYPVIHIRGPMRALSIVNNSTKQQIRFKDNSVIPDGEVWTLDLRPGHKTLMAGTVNKIGELDESSDWDEFHLSPQAGFQGSNYMWGHGQDGGTASQIEIVYYKRFGTF